MRSRVILVLVGASFAITVASCRKPKAEESAPKPDLSAEIQRSEKQAAEREAARVCERPVGVYEGGIHVNSSAYVHGVERGSDYVDEPIDGLDRIISPAKRVRFTLEYPFEKPFAGVVEGEISLRRTIDAIRAGFRTMYAGSVEREIPGMMNKEVTGPYGRGFHVIGDLVIERIDLCADDMLSISIGS